MTNKALSGGRFASPIQVGDAVTRPMGPGATNIHGLLAHLDAAGKGLDAVLPIRDEIKTRIEALLADLIPAA